MLRWPGCTERYLYFATEMCLVRVHLSPLLIYRKNQKQGIPQHSETIDFEKIKLPYGTIPLYIDKKLYLVGPEMNGAAVEVALDVSWDIDDCLLGSRRWGNLKIRSSSTAMSLMRMGIIMAVQSWISKLGQRVSSILCLLSVWRI